MMVTTMKMTPRDTIPLMRQRRRGAGGRPLDPTGDLAMARRLGFNPSTWRARMRKVRAGKMTLEEAMARPVQSHQEISRAGGRAGRRG